jgi:hypothetical protein
LAAARDGDWEPLETHLRDAGQRFAAAGHDVTTWNAINSQFYDAIVPPIVAELAGQPNGSRT